MLNKIKSYTLKKIPWFPILALYGLFSIFFSKNIAIDDSRTDHDQKDLKEEKNAFVINTSFVDLEDFEDFLLGLDDQPLNLHTELHLDTTGDGSLELVKETVALNGEICEVTQEIYKEGKLIWKYHIELNNYHLKTHFGNNEIIENLGPYALFYLGLTYSPFIEKLAKNSTFDDRNKRIIRNYLKDSGLSISEMYQSDIGKRISAYEGYFIFKRNPGQTFIYMWDDREQKYLPLFERYKILT